ncbi:MAG: helix-turn-helix transcriptional regulator [Acidobacteria bacterium]|nr:helix-turn-helix transcriptional regulator [Acidobacteriota bacterium]
MENPENGKFRGKTYQTVAFEGIITTETEYDYRFIDWHYHENPYFSLTTLGTCLDGGKHQTLECAPDSLLFHNCREPHYNSKTDALTRGFQVELSQDWCRKFEIDLERLPASALIRNPNVKLPFYNIYKESKLPDDTSPLTIDSLLLRIVGTMSDLRESSGTARPRWVKRLDEILHDNFDRPLSLKALSVELDLHWGHLSRDFPRYFLCNFSEYIRKIRIEKSLGLLRNRHLSLTEIAFICGFADQSHFIRCFKNLYRITPKKFRRIIS